MADLQSIAAVEPSQSDPRLRTDRSAVQRVFARWLGMSVRQGRGRVALRA